MIITFKGVLTHKEQKKKADGTLMKICSLTFKVNGEELSFDGFGDNLTVGAEYDSILLEITEREWNGRKYPNLFIKSCANPSYMPDKEPEYSAPSEIQVPEGQVGEDDGLPF